MRCIIAGGRGFTDYQRLKNFMDKSPYEITEVVCGKAKGADTLGEKWGLENSIPIKYFIPDWENLGRKAGFLRNKDMGDYANEFGNGLLVAFWDKKSRGTKSMIEYAESIGLTVKVVYYGDIK